MKKLWVIARKDKSGKPFAAAAHYLYHFTVLSYLYLFQLYTMRRSTGSARMPRRMSSIPDHQAFINNSLWHLAYDVQRTYLFRFCSLCRDSRKDQTQPRVAHGGSGS